jgi:hypothetical protein
MITHLSYPEGRAINDFIDPDLCTVRYTSFDNVPVQKIGKLINKFAANTATHG